MVMMYTYMCIGHYGNDVHIHIHVGHYVHIHIHVGHYDNDVHIHIHVGHYDNDVLGRRTVL